MRRHFHVGPWQLQSLQTRHFSTMRVLGAHSRSGCPINVRLTSARHYGGPPQHHPYPPPPPGAYAHAYPAQGGAYGHYNHPPPLPPPPPYFPAGYTPPSFEGPVQRSSSGTKERPFVITVASDPYPWSSRLLVLFFGFIAVSSMANLLSSMESSEGSSKPVSGRLSSFLSSGDIKPVDLGKQTVAFDDIRGCDEAKSELQEVVDFLKNPSKYTSLGAKLPRGVLMTGPPGCGKTMLAKAIAKEAGVTFFYMSGSEFDEVFVGLGARRVRELFAAAKARAPALIFIDEIDAVGGKRNAYDPSYARSTLNQMLSEMDGFNGTEEVMVIAATNAPEALDPALTRPGRFDKAIPISPPDIKGRVQILESYIDRVKHEDGIRVVDVARGTVGFTGADLSNVVNLAALHAAQKDRGAINTDDLEYAKDRVMLGGEVRSKVIPESERKVTAFHEGGHALVAVLLEDEGADPVHKATIVPRGNGIMGLVAQQPHQDRYSQSRKHCLSRLKVALAGRVAEEMILGHDDVTTGASSDIQQATAMARHMVRRFGFSDSLGTVDLSSADSPEGRYMSDRTKERIEEEVHRLLLHAYEAAKVMLEENRSKLDLIAQSLLTRETLSGDELKAILAGTPLPPQAPTSGPKVPIPVRIGQTPQPIS